MRILIFEQGITIGKIYFEISRKLGKSIENIGVVSSVEELGKCCLNACPDLVLLDMDADPETVYGLLGRDELSHSMLVFFSAEESNAKAALRLGAFDFLRSTATPGELLMLIRRAKMKFEAIGKKSSQEDLYKRLKKPVADMVMVWENEQLRPVKVERIIKIKSDGPYSEIHLKDEKTLYSTKNLGAYEDMLKERKFMRIHNSCLVNLDHVKYYKPGMRAFVTLSDSKIEYVSKSKKRNLLDYFNGRSEE